MQKHDVGFGGRDLGDDRAPGEWKTAYESEAIKQIRWEIGYLSITCIGSIALIFIIGILKAEVNSSIPMMLPYLLSGIGGVAGGSVYGMKWTYHVVAKRIWHEDRKFWRYSVPLISGVIAAMFMAIIGSGLFNVFNPEVTSSRSGCVGLGFLLGYFADVAIAKMAEIATTIFGKVPKSIPENPNQGSDGANSNSDKLKTA